MMDNLLKLLQKLGDGEIDDLSVAHDALEEIVHLRIKVDELKQWKEEVEKQEPVYYAPNNAVKNRATTMLVGMYAVNPTDVPLYAHPVPSVPDGWEMLPQDDGTIIVRKRGLGGYVASTHPSDSIASNILHTLATDLLAAKGGS